MRVKALMNLGTNDYPLEYALTEGQEADVPPAIGDKMIKCRHCIQLPDILDEDPNPRMAKVRGNRAAAAEAPEAEIHSPATSPKDFNKLDPKK